MVFYKQYKLIPVGILLIGIALFGSLGVSFAWGSEQKGIGNDKAIVIRSTATVVGSRIYLSDLVERESVWAKRILKNAEQLALLDAPAPGEVKTISGAWIASVIHTRDWVPDTAKIDAPESVRVVRAFQTIPQGRLEAIFRDFIQKKADNTEFKVTRFKVRGTEKFPMGKLRLEAKRPLPKKIIGRVTLRFNADVGGETCGWVALSGWVDRFDTVVCSDRYLRRDTIIEPSDLRIERINLSRAPSDLVRDPDVVVGKQLDRSLQAGAYLRHTILSAPPLVQKGERVKVVARSRFLKVVIIGIAKNSAGSGEQIKVENITSKKTIVGRVTDDATVEILF